MAGKLCMHDVAGACTDCYDLAMPYVGEVTFSQAISESYEHARNKGFHNVAHTGTERLMLAASELFEAFEEFRNGRGMDEIYFVLDDKGVPKPEGVPIEIIDCMIRLFDDAGYYAIPLREAYHLKRDYNKTRDHLHGGKRL